jgi:sugar phosphate isomerase/epimerase
MKKPITRRHFCATSSVAAVGAFTLDLPHILAADDPYGGFPIGVQSYSLRNFNALEAIRHIQGMGLHHVEFFSKHLGLGATDEQIAERQAILKKAEISMSAHGVNSFSSDHAANRRIFEFAKRAGLPCLTANPQPDSFDSLDKLCAEYKVRIAIHNHGPDSLYDKIADVTAAVKGRHPLVGACIDTGHFIRSREDPVKAVHELGPRVFALHIKDEEKQEKRSRNVVIGSGHLDVVAIFKGLVKIGFPADGSLSLEYEATPENPIDAMKQCLVVAQEAIAKVKKG